MAYGSIAGVRRISGISSTTVVSDADITALLIDADANIDRRISVADPTPTLIARISNLLVSIDLYNRPDLRGGFKIGNFSMSQAQVESALKRWQDQVDEYYKWDQGKIIAYLDSDREATV